jgi:uncharacterized protein YndB with AHSA1/START domain
MADATASLAIRKSVAVGVPLETAFRVFTEQIGSWWPLATKSVGQEEAVGLTIEPRVGGRVYERLRSGEEHDWGEILAWDPPRRLVFTWHPGRGAETGQEVEVTFAAARDGTRVDLEHRGWEKLVGPGGEIPAHFESGWEEALARYVEAANG